MSVERDAGLCTEDDALGPSIVGACQRAKALLQRGQVRCVHHADQADVEPTCPAVSQIVSLTFFPSTSMAFTCSHCVR